MIASVITVSEQSPSQLGIWRDVSCTLVLSDNLILFLSFVDVKRKEISAMSFNWFGTTW